MGRPQWHVVVIPPVLLAAPAVCAAMAKSPSPPQWVLKCCATGAERGLFGDKIERRHCVELPAWQGRGRDVLRASGCQASVQAAANALRTLIAGNTRGRVDGCRRGDHPSAWGVCDLLSNGLQPGACGLFAFVAVPAQAAGAAWDLPAAAVVFVLARHCGSRFNALRLMTQSANAEQPRHHVLAWKPMSALRCRLSAALPARMAVAACGIRTVALDALLWQTTCPAPWHSGGAGAKLLADLATAARSWR